MYPLHLILIILISLGISSCSDSNKTPPILEFTRAPIIQSNPNPAAPMVAIVTFQPNLKVTTTITASSGKNQFSVSFDASRNPAMGLPVIGFQPEQNYDVFVTIKDAHGNEVKSDTLTFQSPSLPVHPAEFPGIKVGRVDVSKAEPGYRLFNPRRRIPRETQLGNDEELRFGESFGMLVMVDTEGNPVWYYQTGTRIAGFSYQKNGHIFYVTADFRLVEIDLLGNTVRSWYASQRPQGKDNGIPVDVLTFHHDADLMANGNIIALSSEKRILPNYYTSEYDENAPRKEQSVMGDRIVEFTPEGKIIWDWKAFDHLPAERIGFETFSTYWERRSFPGTIDWSHANEVTKLEDGSVMVNFRYQSAIVNLDGDTGEVRWIFGEPSGWSPELESKLIKLEGDARWPWHQHAPLFTERGTLLMFDNGNYRARPFEQPTPVAETWSRAVEYEVDFENFTARQIWTSERDDEDKYVTIAMGNASETPTKNNLLVGYGAIVDPDRVSEMTWVNQAQFDQMTRCIEYTRSSPAEIVWELELVPTGHEPKIGWNVFGCKIIPELKL